MNEFINTIDVLGDNVVIESIIDGSITEFKDNTIENFSTEIFRHCTLLINVDMPILINGGGTQFYGCSSLKSANFPKLLRGTAYMFNGCINLTDVYIPEVDSIETAMFQDARSIQTLDCPKVKNITGANNFLATQLKTLILRSETLCVLNATNPFGPASGVGSTPISQGVGYIYVPRALLDDSDATKDYRRATNWSTYSTQFRALEDYTIDGTVTGELGKLYAITNSLLNVDNSNESDDIVSKRQYVATLTSTSAYPIESVTVTMDGVDITTDAYNADTGEVSIASVTGDIVISAKAKNDYGHHVTLVPLNGAEEGELPGYRINVTANQVITVTYLLTKKAGFVYDGRSCGLTYSLSNNVINAETTTTITIPQDGIIAFSVHHNASVANGTLSPDAAARLYGKYFHIDIS